MAIDILPAQQMHRPSPLHFFRRRRERAAADRWIETHDSSIPNATVRRRIAELTSRPERTLLAKSLRGAVRTAGHAGLSASPLNRRAVGLSAGELTELAWRLSDVDRPVAPRGVLLARRLLTDGGSPLYAHERGAELPAAVARIRASLDAFSPAGTPNSRQQGPQLAGGRDDANTLRGDAHVTAREER